MNYRAHPFSLRQVQYAAAVAESGGFGSAASLCGVSQPALSAQVSKLEDALEVQLFERHARKVMLTARGRELLPQLRSLLEGADQVQQHAAVLGGLQELVLRVGVIPTVAPYLLPKQASALRALPFSLHWLELQTHQCEAALSAGDLDAMLIADPPSSPSFQSMDLGFEPFHLLVPVEHALRGSVTSEAVQSAELLLLEDGHCLRDQTLQLCLIKDSQRSPYRATSLATIVQMVAAGMGVTVIPESAVQVETRTGLVRALPFEQGKVGRKLRLIWRSRSPLSSQIVALGDLLKF